MLKDIVVHIPVDDRTSATIDCSISLAQRFDAHLDGVVRVYESFNSAVAIAVPSTAMELTTVFEPNLEMAAGILEQFETAAKIAGVSHGSRTICEETSSVWQSATDLSRLYSLVVVAQPDSEKPTNDDPLVETLLLRCGRPLLVVPYIQRGPLDANHILICWDGGSSSARAVHDAMPFLRKATTIDIVAVNGGEATARNAPEALKDHLSRHGLTAHVHRLFSDETEIHDVLLSFAADVDAGLIVMGGYGHSKLREYVLGGVTRGILETMTVPVLMSH